MDNIILGLLLLHSRTIYQLRARIGKGLDLMYSSSTGSIQAAIKKLLGCGYIDCEEMIDGGKRKKIYRITESGRQHFLAWVNAPIAQQGIRCPELVKLYFMGFSDRENREAIIARYLLFLKEQYRALEMICADAADATVSESGREIFSYQLASAIYGKDLYKFNIDWFDALLSKMRSGEL